MAVIASYKLVRTSLEIESSDQYTVLVMPLSSITSLSHHGIGSLREVHFGDDQ